jgi:SAM-dependent methyltransferase
LDTVKELVKKGDGPGLVSNFAALSRSQPGEVVKLVADRTTLVSALKVIGQDQASLALLHLQFGASATPGRTLNDGLKLLVASVGLSRAGWMQLVAGRDAAQQAAVVADAASQTALRGVEGDPMDLLPGLSMSPDALRAARAQEALARRGLASRVECIGGSFLRDPLPRGADIISLVRIVHDHDDESALALLRAVHAALPSGGTLLIAEPMAGTPGAEPIGDAYFGFYLLAMGAGRLRTSRELMAMMADAGFTHLEVVPNPMPLQTQILVGRKSQGLHP